MNVFRDHFDVLQPNPKIHVVLQLKMQYFSQFCPTSIAD